MAPPNRKTKPDAEAIRRRLRGLIERMEAADTMPLSERDVRMWRTVLPNMTKWLPADEGAMFRERFEVAIRRLGAIP